MQGYDAYSAQFQMEVAYTRQEIGRLTHILREWEAREKELYIRYGLTPPLTQRESDANTISALEGRLSNIARDHVGYIERLKSQLATLDDLIFNNDRLPVGQRDVEVLSLKQRVNSLEAEKKRLIEDHGKIAENLKRGRLEEDTDQSSGWMEVRSNRRAIVKQNGPEVKFLSWKDLIRRELPSYRFDGAGTEKRIKAAIGLFLSSESASIPAEHYRMCLPAGNGAKNQILIPTDLEFKFLKWFKEQDKGGFRNYEGKRKATHSDLIGSISKRPKSNFHVHQPFELSLLSTECPKEDMQILPFDQLLLGSNGEDLSDLIPKVKVWLLLKMGAKFPSCLVEVCDERTKTYGIPKHLQEEFVNVFAAA